MWLIIGISGATCSGKSSLAHSLQEILQGSTLICQDDFFLPEDSEKHTLIPNLKHNNWEIMSSLDMEKMHKTVNNILSSKSVKTTSLQTLEKIANEISSNNSEKGTEITKRTGDHRERFGTSTDTMAKINGEYSNTGKRENVEAFQMNILIIEGFLIFNDKKLADLCQMKYFLTLEREECWTRRNSRTYNPPDVPGYFDQCVWPEYVKHRDQVFQQVSDINIIDGTKTRSTILNEVLLDIVRRAKVII
ncbi:hypothetical protein L9F63_003413 [Diploptera punctata]|uniref:Phosphoribulokinase/uridine kinase domain-containing protein n=1 Tax=Diploptera punctata TaxID=6984 RepID=A0AAD8EA43_DIPPU|nr:hypothetical protein L9F63_003413 [Diploptera punctata]